jgi:hypothetical protein
MIKDKISFRFAPTKQERAETLDEARRLFKACIEKNKIGPQTIVRLVTDGSDCIPESRNTHYTIFMGVTDKGFMAFSHGTEIDEDLSLVQEFHVIPLPDIVWLLEMFAGKLENN